VMQYQSKFSLPVNLGRQGLLQIAAPTHQESVLASVLVNQTLDSLDSLAARVPA
jgi:hypothetical protein